MLRGDHLLMHWSRTQQVVALSSAEAELHGLCKAASEGLAARNMSIELMAPLPLQLRTDSSAARGIIQRQGCGKVKHLDVKSLWIQEREAEGDGCGLSSLQCASASLLDEGVAHHKQQASR